jgi:hypothetical protein
MPWIVRTNRLPHLCTAIAIALTMVGFVASVRAQTPTNGLIMLIEFEKIDGIRQRKWLTFPVCDLGNQSLPRCEL